MGDSVTLLKTVLTRPRRGAITIGSQRDAPPPLPTDATNRDTKLADAARARNVELARTLAKRAVADNGELRFGDDSGTANRMRLELRMTGQDKTPQGQHLDKILKQLEEDEALRGKLDAIEAPKDGSNPALGMIRTTLGLPPDAPVTDAHAKQATLAALAAELRQQDVGSCYGTSVAIRVHNRQPGKFLDDMKQILANGSLKRSIGGQVVEVPIPPQMSLGALEKKITLGADGKMTKAGAAALSAPVSLAETPPVVGAMTGLGIASGERAASVDKALAQLRKTRAGDAALAALPATVDAETKSKFAEALLKRLAQDIPADQAIRETAEELPGLGAGKAAVIGAAKTELDKTEVEIKPAALVRQLAMDKAGVSEGDVRALEQMRSVAAQWRAEMQNSQDSPKFQQLTAEYERLQKQLDLGKLARFEQLMVSGQDGYTGEEDNRLLRAWEYSVTQMAEIGEAQHHGDKMRAGTTKAVGAEMDRIPNFLRDTTDLASKQPKVLAKLGDVKDRLKTEYERLYKAQIQARYNAEIEGGKSADGSSSRGATVLYDMSDPAQPWPITDKASFAKIVGGLAMNAFANLYGNEPDAPTRDAARLVAEEMSRRAASDGFQSAAAAATKEAYRRPGETDDKLNERAASMKLQPWQSRAGDFANPLMKAYFEKDPVPEATKVPTDPKDLGQFVIATLKGMFPANKDTIDRDPADATVPVSGGPHAFLLTPGHPSLKAALESGDDPATYLTKKIEADRKTGQAQCATPLTEGVRDAMVDAVIPEQWPNRDAWKAAVIRRLGPDATVQQVKQAAMDTMTDAKFKKILGDRAELAVARAVPPPLAARGPETLAQVSEVMRDLKVPTANQAAVASKVVARLGAAAAGKPAVDAAVVERTVLQTLEEEGLKTPEMTSGAVQSALRKGMKKPEIVFADSNWGGGDHNIMFALMVNPMTGQPEMLRMNEDGSNMSKMDTAEWVTKKWSIATDPATFGGM